jgi:cytochrome c5
MIKNWIHITLAIVLLSAIPLVSQTGSNNNMSKTDDQHPAKSKTAQTPQDGDGQQVFQQNCARCHDAPQGFSTRIAGTITKHMRVPYAPILASRMSRRSYAS